jgi:hypothetical protein
MRLVTVVVFILACRALICQTTSAAGSKPTVPKLSDVNPELLRLVIEDQWDRGNDMFGGRQVKNPETLDWKEVGTHDERRHAEVRKMLTEGRIQSARECYFGVLIFQHSSKPEDLMLAAHILAVTAVGKGSTEAKYMAAATLDRYLTTIKQPQVFGTQFFRRPGEQKSTMEPYDQSILSDGECAIWCVMPVSEQNRILKDVQNGKPMVSTQIPDCK